MSSQQSDTGNQKEAASHSGPSLRAMIAKHRILLLVGMLLVGYTLCGFFLAPYLVERYLPGILQNKLVCSAAIGKVRINPLLLTVEANDFSISEADGTPVAGFGRLFLDFELKGLFRWAWTFKAFQLENPEVSIVMEQEGSVNLTKLIPEKKLDRRGAAPINSDDEDAAPPRLVVENIELLDGAIHVADLRQSEPARADIMPLNIRLERISTLP